MKQLPEGYKAVKVRGENRIIIIKVATKQQVTVRTVARPVSVPVSAPASVFPVVAKIYAAAPKAAPVASVGYGVKGSLGNNRGFSLLR